MPYPCPCCGFLTLPVPREEAITHICPVRFGEYESGKDTLQLILYYSKEIASLCSIIFTSKAPG